MSKRQHSTSHRSLRQFLQLPRGSSVPTVVLVANAEDAATGSADEVFAFKKPAGRFGIERVPREKAFNANALASAIIAKNGLLPRDDRKAAEIVDEACKKPPREFWLHVAADGWQSGEVSAFCHRGTIHKAAPYGKLILKPPLSDLNRKYPLRSHGSTEGWQRIARLAMRSSRLRLAISAAFAAPLLSVVGWPSFTIVLAGRSKAGKSTALLAASSVIGIGQESGLPNFNATAPALQETALEFVDRVMPVNEIGLVKGARKSAYDTLRPLTYRYAEGRDTARHSKSPYSTSGATMEWRGVMLVSSENTFEALANMAGEKRDEGEYARAFDVPAVRPGCTTVFDHLPSGLSGSEQDKWARSQLMLVRELCGMHHGAAFDSYAAFLVRNRDRLQEAVERHMEAFLATLPTAQSGALQHAARNFALLYAGAAVGHEAGLLPHWRQEPTLRDLRVCFCDGVAEIEHSQGSKERARSKLIGNVRAIGSKLAKAGAGGPTAWRSHDRQGRLTFCVRTQVFESWFDDRDEVRAAIQWLYEAKLLCLIDGSKPNYLKLGWAVTFERVNGDNKRVYRFRDPRQIAG